MRTENRIRWNNAFRNALVGQTAEATDCVMDGDTTYFFKAELGDNGYVVSCGVHSGILLDDDMPDAESDAEYNRIAGGNGEDREWVLNTAPAIIEAWIADGMPPIYDPDSDTPNAGDPSIGCRWIAKLAHEANRVYCDIIQDDKIPTPCSWLDATDHIKDSAVQGVQFVLANPYAGDAASHENWMRFKMADGWKYGEVKDENAKTHPCLVPFDKLPKAQQVKDALFRGVVLAFRAK